MSRLEITYPDNGIFTQPIRTTHEGFGGGSKVKCIQIGNRSPEHYYTNISVSVEEVGGVDVDVGDIFSSNGWGIKLLSLEEEPTEKDWANRLSNQSLNLDNIGDEENASTDQIQKVWIRIFCPGHSDPDILMSKLKLQYNTLLVTNAVP